MELTLFCKALGKYLFDGAEICSNTTHTLVATPYPQNTAYYASKEERW
jgi:hypothetical protein